ncbi:MAG: hypothetical protein K1X79_06970 [Oligoflexia bacterium]|nr:hypothetical protein [Oligoflexia bacterium]
MSALQANDNSITPEQGLQILDMHLDPRETEPQAAAMIDSVDGSRRYLIERDENFHVVSVYENGRNTCRLIFQDGRASSGTQFTWPSGTVDLPYNSKLFLEALVAIREGKLISMSELEEVTVRRADEQSSEKGPTEEGRYRDRKTVNGIEISVAWDALYGDYTIYFPQIDLTEAWQRQIYDQVLRLSTLPEIAKVVFAYAVETAPACSDVYQLYEKVQGWSRQLPYDLK